MELVDITNLKKTESYLTTPHILLQHLQPIHIDMTGRMKTPTQTLLSSYHQNLILI